MAGNKTHIINVSNNIYCHLLRTWTECDSNSIIAFFVTYPKLTQNLERTDFAKTPTPCDLSIIFVLKINLWFVERCTYEDKVKNCQ